MAYNKRGQLAIFVIVALVIVGVILMIFWLNRGPGPVASIDVNPIPYLKSCVEPEIQSNVVEIAKKGGYSDPQGALDYNGDKIKYLCYTSENYKTCVIQQPMIKEHFEKEVSDKIGAKAEECIQDLKKAYEKKGYSVNLGTGKTEFTFNLGNMRLDYGNSMTISKGDNSKTFNGFKVDIASQMYDLIMLSGSVIDYEATYGDSETALYMQYYPNLRIDKIRLSSGEKVYTLSDVVTNESFRFATRSLVWPVGYGP